MSVAVLHQVWERSGQKASRLLLMTALADNANDDGWAWPGVPLLARKTRMTERYVQIMLRDLEDDGEISVHEGEGPHRSNLYHIHPGVYAAIGDGPDGTFPVTKTVKHSSPSDGDPEITPAETDGEPQITDMVNPDSPGGEPQITDMVNPDSPKPPVNRHGTTTEPPCDDPAESIIDEPGGGGVFGTDWDPGDREPQWVTRPPEVSGPDDEDRGGWWDGQSQEPTATALKPPERAAFTAGLVGGGSPSHSAPLPQAMALEEFELELTRLGVKYPKKLRTLPLRYDLALARAHELAKGGAGGGAIYMDLRDHGADLVAAPTPHGSAAREFGSFHQDTGASDPSPPGQERPVWANAAAWGRTDARLRMLLVRGEIANGWIQLHSRVQGKVDANPDYRAAITRLLYASGIVPTPPAPSRLVEDAPERTTWKAG